MIWERKAEFVTENAAENGLIDLAGGLKNPVCKGFQTLKLARHTYEFFGLYSYLQSPCRTS